MTSLISREDIRRVVVILAGSRTGSSFLFSALKGQAEFLAPTGEETPFYRLAGLGNFNGLTYSDAIHTIPGKRQLDAAFEALSQDLGVRRTTLSDPNSLAGAFLARLALQWPDLISPSRYSSLKDELVKRLQDLPPDWTDWPATYLDWLDLLQRQGFAVSRAPFNAATPFAGPIHLLEEPPFICPEPKLSPTRALADQYPLLLKTSSNTYRTDFLRALFPRAEFKWIVLRRNPASTISALMDGWLSGGFHSHDVHPHVRLGIKGYSDVVPLGDRYWKFDMPPGWQEFITAPLAEVCAFQWATAYQTIERFRHSTGDPFFDVSYEDLLAPRARDVFKKLIHFAGAEERSETLWQPNHPVATVIEPSMGKWKKRAAEIIPLLQNHRGGLLLEMAGQMNYDHKQLDHWL